MKTYTHLSKTIILFLLCNLFTNVVSAQLPIGLNFDGIDDRCTINDNAAYDLGTGNFTIEAWIKANSSQSFTFPTVLSNRETGNVNSGLLVYLVTGQIALQMDGINLAKAGNDLRDNICHHIAISRTGSTVTYYIDGSLVSTQTGFGQNINAAHAFWIGHDDPASTTTRFKGLIHEVRYWNLARTLTQIQGSMNLYLAGNETGLIGYWRMNEGTGQIMNDFSPLNNDGFLGTINTTDSADPVYANSCYCTSPNSTITANGPITFCTGGSVVLSASSGAGYGYQWRLNGTNIGGATLQNYTASVGGSYTCVVTIISTGCSATSNTITVTVSSGPAASITAQGSTVFCTGGSVNLSANSGTGLTYQWKKNGGNISGATSQIYNATTAGTYTCVVTDNCGSSTSNAIVVTVYTSPPAAIITANGSTAVCSGSSVLLSANTGTGYSWQWKLNGNNISGAVSANYSASLAGNYTCVVTNACGSSTSNTITITIVALPTATITPGGPTSFCGSGSVLLTANSGTGYTYQWKLNNSNIAGATAQTYSATQAGSYTVVVTASGCSKTSTAVVVTIDQPLAPTITNIGWSGFCASTSVGLETSIITGGSYQWFEDTHAVPNTNSYHLDVGHDGNYSVNVTNSCGTYSSLPVTVTDFIGFPFGMDPFITIGYTGSLAICSGGSASLFINSSSYYWSPTFQWYKNGVAISGANGTTYTATTPGDYVCAVSDYNFFCGVQSPFIFSNFLTATTGTGTAPTVTISAGGPITFCGPGSVTLNSTVNTSVTYQWKKNGLNISGATSASYTSNSTGTFTCSVTNSCGTVTSNSIVVTVQTLTVTISAGTLNICTGSSTTLTATAQTGNTYQWKLNGSNINGATNSTYAATAGGSYTCAITNLCGSTTSNTLVMTLRPLPTAAISGTQTICSGNSAAISINFTGTANWWGYYYNGSSYTNFNTASDPLTVNVSPTVNTTYTLYSSFHDFYCYGSVSGSAVVTVQSSATATITPAGPTTFCSGGSVVLNANTGTGLTYQWKKNGTNISGATLSSYTATTAGSYTVVVTNSCSSATSGTVTVTVNSLPNATITPAGPTTFCAGGSVTLNAVVASNRTYQWKKNGTNISGATASSYVATASGTYKVTVTNTVTGCTKTTATGIVVTKNPLPAATISPSGTITFCAGQSALLTANSGAGYTYKWKKNGSYISGATSITYTVTTAGNYRVEVTNSNGCSKTSNADTVNVPCREGESIAESVASFDMTIYPNPSPGVFTIQLSEKPSAPVTIEITDVIGKVVDRFTVNDETVVLDKSNLAPGVYYLSARSKEMMLVKKLVIQ